MKLNRFEELAERLVEGSLTRLFVGQLHPREIVVQLARAMEDSATGNEGGETKDEGQPSALCPSSFVVGLHPMDYAAIAEHRIEIEASLAQQVMELARQGGFVLAGSPKVTVRPDPAVARLSVVARPHPGEPDGHFHTQVLERQVPPPQANPRPAWLIVGGRRNIPLTKAVVTLGRRLDNEVVLDDARVSRQHAQLRWRYGHYVLYDLGSKGGTTVNGVPTQECLLQSGDVISLAGVQIIYVEDEPPANPPSLSQDTLTQ